ncbi:MAG: helix-turn-helix domain-containing protein [Rhodococcus sp. (in: high G+C Gram-positive bacteria)]
MTTHTALRPEPTDSKTRPLLVSIKQASAMLSISRSVIYQLMDAGHLTPIRIGRSVRLPVEQLERFVADRLADADRDGGPPQPNSVRGRGRSSRTARLPETAARRLPERPSC